MPKYVVHIERTLKYVIPVDADTEAEAEEAAHELLSDEYLDDTVLSAETEVFPVTPESNVNEP